MLTFRQNIINLLKVTREKPSVHARFNIYVYLTRGTRLLQADDDSGEVSPKTFLTLGFKLKSCTSHVKLPDLFIQIKMIFTKKALVVHSPGIGTAMREKGKKGQITTQSNRIS